MIEHLEIYYGKFFDQITTKIPTNDILYTGSGSIGRSLEPGLPNLPTSESFSFTLNNLNEDESEKYPMSFWLSESRTEAEGATQILQIYFKVAVNGITQFVGILKDVKYVQWNAQCRISLGDISELLRAGGGRMLKSFSVEGLSPESIDAPSIGNNTLPTLRDLDGNVIPHEAMTFLLGASAWSSTQVPQPKLDIIVDDPDATVTAKRDFEFAFHLGWDDLDYIFSVSLNNGSVLAESIRPVWVQIDEITVFTRVRFWVIQIMNDAGTRFRQELRCTIWHNAQVPSGQTLPIGRFLFDDQLITEVTSDMEIIFHEPNLGFDDDISVFIGLLPSDKNFIFGIPYKESGGEIVMTQDDYAYFDIIKATTDILNTNIAINHTSQQLTGSFTIETGANPVGGGTKADALLVVTGAPFSSEDIFIRMTAPDGVTQLNSSVASISPTDTLAMIAQKLASAIDSGTTSVLWNGSNPASNEVLIEADATGSDENGWLVQVFSTEFGDVGLLIKTGLAVESPTDGGTDGDFFAEGIDIYIGENLIATTANIAESETPEDVAIKCLNALQTANPANYSFTRDVATINIVSVNPFIEQITLDTKATGVTWTSQDITGDFNAFNTDRLIDENRLVYWSDLMMFGWAENSILEAIIRVTWQVSGFLFTNKDGQFSLHSRRWFEVFPDNLNSPDFDAIQIPDEDWEPLGGDQFETGFISYETDHPTSLIPVNNLVSPETKKIFSDKDGKRDKPALKNQSVRIGNFRIGDLSVTSLGNLFRRSPSDPLFPSALTLDNFISTPQLQLDRIAKSLVFPVKRNQIRIYQPDFPAVDVGGYIYGQDGELYLVTRIRVQPQSLTYELEIEFKKEIIDFKTGFAEGMNVGERFIFRQVIRQVFSERIGVEENFNPKIAVTYNEGVNIDETYSPKVAVTFKEGANVGETYSDSVT